MLHSLWHVGAPSCSRTCRPVSRLSSWRACGRCTRRYRAIHRGGRKRRSSCSKPPSNAPTGESTPLLYDIAKTAQAGARDLFSNEGVWVRTAPTLGLTRRLGNPGDRRTDRATRHLKRIDALLRLHTPDVLVLQDTSKTGTHRAPRIRALNRRTLKLAKRRGIPVRTYSREQIVGYFEDLGATTKHRIAETIAKHIPVLSLYVPPPRKPWKSEDPRMGIFDAAALAWMFMHSNHAA